VAPFSRTPYIYIYVLYFALSEALYSNYNKNNKTQTKKHKATIIILRQTKAHNTKTEEKPKNTTFNTTPYLLLSIGPLINLTLLHSFNLLIL